jgi:hypothetical protein
MVEVMAAVTAAVGAADVVAAAAEAEASTVAVYGFRG